MKIFRNLVCFGIVALLLSACESDKDPAKMAAAMQRPAPRVGVVPLTSASVVLYSEMPGRTVAFETAEVRPEVTGIIKERVFQEGAYVQEGDILYLIERDVYKANYDSALASLARSDAAMNVAKMKERRTARLLNRNSISQQDYDETRAVYLQGKAEVASATAAVQLAKINLDRTEIRAPISGFISKSMVSIGTLITLNQAAALATIYQINPINVDLTQAVSDLVDVRGRLNNGKSDNLQNLDLPVSLIMDNSMQYDHIGMLSFIDVGVDESTATVTLRAEFPNPQFLLVPGLFVRAKMQIGVDDNAVLVPQRAILRDARGKPYVFIAEGFTPSNMPAPADLAQNPAATPKAKAARRSVQLGDSYGTNWLVSDGVKAGESVILEGLQNVTEGTEVAVVKLLDSGIPEDASYLTKNAQQAMQRTVDGNLSKEQLKKMESNTPIFAQDAEKATSKKTGKPSNEKAGGKK